MNRPALYFLAVIIVSIIAGGYRIYAANKLNVDIDEPVYLTGGLEYADYLREGRYEMLSQPPKILYEHPAFYRILYGAILLTQPKLTILEEKDLPRFGSISRSPAHQWALTSRYLSVFWGTIAVIFLAVIDPLAGLFLATQTLSVKYTSEIYLEALPLLTSLLCILTYLRWFTKMQEAPAESHRYAGWLLSSAIFLGITAASKYVYCVAGIGIIIHFAMALLQKQISWRTLHWLIGWGVLSIIFFFIFDPFLWVDSVQRLRLTIDYHLSLQNYVHNKLISSKKDDYPFWQPIRWLMSPSSFYDLGPNTVFKVNIDLFIFILALIGLPRFFQKRRLFFYWFAAGLIFLLLWGAKWSQYILIILVPFSLAASEGTLTIWELAQNFLIPKTGKPNVPSENKTS